jgi:hypothetical protein
MKKLLFLLAILPTLLFNACDNELDINGEYKNIAIVYGIIDPGSQRQYIRINRAFLTEDNALVAAEEPDSSNYPYLLNVTIKEYNANNQLVNTYLLDTVHLPKTNGAFNTGYQPYYYFDIPSLYTVYEYNELTNDTVFLNPDNSFKLNIENPVTGDITEAETPFIPNFTVSKPAPYNKFVSLTSLSRINVEMKSAPYGKLYEAKFIFFYREIYSDNPLDTIVKQIEWNLGSDKSDRIAGGEDIVISYIPYTFFNILKQRIPDLPNVQRLHGMMTPNGRIDIQLVIAVGADELSTYIDANSPSGSIIQDKPIYSNITNGIGIFSAKRVVKLNYYLNYLTVDSLRNGSVDYLNFQ